MFHVHHRAGPAENILVLCCTQHMPGYTDWAGKQKSRIAQCADSLHQTVLHIGVHPIARAGQSRSQPPQHPVAITMH